jgi:uncharacterized protein YifE (UPF0438 family)
MMKITIVFVSMVAVLLISCSGSNTDNSISLKTGKYSYVISDSAGNPLVEGIIKLDSAKNELYRNNYKVNGSFTITKNTADTSYHGLSGLSAGELSAYYNDSTKFININTNPRIADANVFINAYVKGKEIKGGWHFSTLRGNKEGGLFKAVTK